MALTLAQVKLIAPGTCNVQTCQLEILYYTVLVESAVVHFHIILCPSCKTFSPDLPLRHEVAT